MYRTELSVNPTLSHVVAITGTIGSGKSTVIELLRKQKAFVVSADEIAREVVLPGTTGLKQVVDTFGPGILADDGALDRKKMGTLVFADGARKKALEALLHPLIAKRAEEIFKDAIARGVSPIVYEVPLLFEAGLHKAGFKKIIVVTADDDTCIERVMKRDGLSIEQARERLASQIPTEVKLKGADVVLDNSGSISELERAVLGIFPNL